MKRIAVLVLALALICAALCSVGASDATDYVQGKGFSYDTKDNGDGVLRCDYIVRSSSKAAVEWSDSGHVYTVSGDVESIANLYVGLLGKGSWDSCRYVIGNKARVSYGVKSKKQCATIDEYTREMTEAFTGHTSTSDSGDRSKVDKTEKAGAPTVKSGPTTTYVLNTNSKKFHYPDCPSAKKIKDKNRKEYTGSRDTVIANGYVPCKNCDP